jgi:hypothetical protein
MRFPHRVLASALPLFLLGMTPPAAVSRGSMGDPSPLSIRADASTGGLRQAAESTTVTTTETVGGWTLDGPYFLRSADPLPPGELELKFIYSYEDEAHGHAHELGFALEWGMADNIEFILETEVEVGDGRVDGNGDIEELGFHIRHWEENGWMPAVATRHLVRLPTGYHSDGVDYLGRALFTWTLAPECLRLHFNPWLKSVNGNREEDTRWFQWGAAVGFDYRVNEELVIVADYQNSSSEEFGSRNQHSIELGADWEFAENRLLAFGTEFEVDGDDSGSNIVASVSYIFELH